MWEHLLNCVGASMYFTVLGTHDSLRDWKSMVWPGVCSGYWENIFVCKKYKKRILISSIWFNCLKWIQMHFIEKCNEKRNSNINIHCALDVEEASMTFQFSNTALKNSKENRLQQVIGSSIFFSINLLVRFAVRQSKECVCKCNSHIFSFFSHLWGVDGD